MMGEGHAPVVAVLLASAKGRKPAPSIFAPIGVRPLHPEQDSARFAGNFGCGRGTVMGAKGGDYRPHPYLCAKSHPPVVAVLLASQEADESITAPKGHGPPNSAAFS